MKAYAAEGSNCGMPAGTGSLVWCMFVRQVECAFVREPAYRWASQGILRLSESRACAYFLQDPGLLSELVTSE